MMFFYPARSSASQGVGNRWHALGKPGRDWGSDGILAWRRTGHDLHCWGEEQGKGRLARPRSTRVRVDNANGVVPMRSQQRTGLAWLEGGLRVEGRSVRLQLRFKGIHLRLMHDERLKGVVRFFGQDPSRDQEPPPPLPLPRQQHPVSHAKPPLHPRLYPLLFPRLQINLTHHKTISVTDRVCSLCSPCRQSP